MAKNSLYHLLWLNAAGCTGDFTEPLMQITWQLNLKADALTGRAGFHRRVSIHGVFSPLMRQFRPLTAVAQLVAPQFDGTVRALNKYRPTIFFGCRWSGASGQHHFAFTFAGMCRAPLLSDLRYRWSHIHTAMTLAP